MLFFSRLPSLKLTTSECFSTTKISFEMRHDCKISPNKFCFILRVFLVKTDHFSCEKKRKKQWALHLCCASCSMLIRQWMKGNQSIPSTSNDMSHQLKRQNVLGDTKDNDESSGISAEPCVDFTPTPRETLVIVLSHMA